MKVTKYVVLVLAAVVLVGSAAWAQQDRPERPARREGRAPAARESLKAFYDRALQQLDLDEVEKTRVNEKLQTNQQALANWEKQHGEDLQDLRAKLRKAREDNDEKALAELRAKRTQISTERGKLEEKLHMDVLAVLRLPKQKETLVGLVLRGRAGLEYSARVRLALAALDMPKAQIEKADKILELAAAEVAKITDPRQRLAPWQKAVEEIKTKVIIDAAKVRKFDELLRAPRGGGLLAGLNLTAEQQKQYDQIMAEARKKAADADAEQRRTILREAMQKVRDEVLTESQRAQLQKRRAALRERGGGQRRQTQDRPQPQED